MRPKVVIDSHQGYTIGPLTLLHGLGGDVTTVTMTYDLLDPTYIVELANSNSTEFISYATSFCTEVSTFCILISSASTLYSNQRYTIGPLIILHGLDGGVTTVTMTYDLLDPTYIAELASPNSTKFISYVQK